jgi:hypothetical protein
VASARGEAKGTRRETVGGSNGRPGCGGGLSRSAPHAHGDEEPGEGCGKVALDFFFVLFLFLRTASRVDLDAPPVAFRSHDMLSSQRPLHCVKFFLEN